MSGAEPVAQPVAPELSGGSKARLLLASTIGSMVEWYDFFVFAACSVLVFSKVFYAGLSPSAALLVSLGTFAVGFMARPVGGILFGIFGDKFGRKRTLVVSLLIMGITTMSMGLLPTYAQIGMAAPMLLVLLRILQGIAVGGEATGALLIVAESMSARYRGFWSSIPIASGPAANVLAFGLLGLVRNHFGDAAFLAGAWRIPFLASVVLIGIGLWARRRIDESPAFVALAAKAAVDKAPLRDALRYFKKPMAQVFLVKAGENVMLYLFSTFFLVLATTSLGFDQRIALHQVLTASFIEVPVILLAGLVSDHIGRRPVILVGLLGTVAASFVLFTHSAGVAAGTLQLMVIAALCFHGVINGGMAAFFTELFPTRVRYTALSAGYQLASVAGGSLAPLIGTWLLQRTGTPAAVAVYAGVMAAPAILCVIFSRETRRTNLNAA